MLLDLDLLSFRSRLTLREEDAGRKVFDPVRKKWVAFQPEEFVRQLLIQYFNVALGYPLVRMKAESALHHLNSVRRYDLAIFERSAKPFLIAECKAPNVPIRTDVFFQAATYNLHLSAPYMLATNGQVTYCAHIDFESKSYAFMDKVPANTY